MSQKIRIKILAFDHTVVDEASRMILQTAKENGATIKGPIPLPTQIKKFTVNRSTFVDKNSREQFEMRKHRRFLDLTEASPKTIEALSNLNLPSGVEIEIKMLQEKTPVLQ